MAWTKLKDIFATKKEINEVRDSLSQKQRNVFVNRDTKPTEPLDIAKRIVNACRTTQHEMSIGVVDNFGFYGYIAHTYPKGSDYATVLILNWSESVWLACQNDGKWSIRAI